MDKIIRIHASSGTTGRPTVVGYTQQDIDNWADLIARSLRLREPRKEIKSTLPTATAYLPVA